MKKHSKIYIAGHRGLVGSAIISRLKAEGYSNVITSMHSELDLTRQREVEEFFDKQRPDYVFLAAAKVGGIWANNTYRADFIYSNLTIQTNVIHACHYYKVDKLLFLGSSCIYPKHCPQPMKEEHLLSGYLESTNEPYAIAKIAGIKMCQAYHRQYGSRFISVMPTNLYGPNDNFDSETSHVLPALIRKFHEAKITGSDEVVLWGTGKPKREFLHVDDLADACIYLMDNYEDSTIIKAELIAGVVGFDGALTFDSTKPDGTFQKLLDVSRIESLGWKAKVSLEQGIADTYKWYVENVAAK
ncbi:MAG: GDP-L-fucose synthase [Deltaproteobacteria bacterium]|nr:GDP-L-fucose synthase [Deltaproteobacteria bacterium]